jgi:thiol-disulfide isomerase/thioredoxin
MHYLMNTYPKMIRLCLSFVLLSLVSQAQNVDSAWLAKEYLPRFYVDTATFLPTILIKNEQNKKTTLADYHGKIVYLDLWAIWCGNCLIKFPHQEQLQKRLKAQGLDTLIELVNLNMDDTEKVWRNALAKYHPVGKNLYCSDTAILEKWNIESLPAYILLDSSGKVLGKDICEPDEGSLTDYVLYAATKGIHPVEAILRQHEQISLSSEYKSVDAMTDPDFKHWFKSNMQLFIEYARWRENLHRKPS